MCTELTWGTAFCDRFVNASVHLAQLEQRIRGSYLTKEGLIGGTSITLAKGLFQVPHDILSLNGVVADLTIVEQIIKWKNPVSPIADDAKILSLCMRNHDRCEVGEIAVDDCLELSSREQSRSGGESESICV